MPLNGKVGAGVFPTPLRLIGPGGSPTPPPTGSFSFPLLYMGY